MYLLTEGGDTLTTESGTKLAIHPFALCDWPTVQEVKDYLGITDLTQDPFIQSSIDATSGSIENYLNQKIPLQYRVEYYRKSNFDPGFVVRLPLGSNPVESVVCVLGDDAEIAYTRDDKGIGGYFYNYNKLEVRYYGGYCPIPAEILGVFYQIMAIRWSMNPATGSLSNGPIKKEAIPGVYSIEYYNTEENATGYNRTSPMEYSSTLDRFKSTFI